MKMCSRSALFAGCAALVLGTGCASSHPGPAPTSTWGTETALAMDGQRVLVAGMCGATYGPLNWNTVVPIVPIGPGTNPSGQVWVSGYWGQGTWSTLAGDGGQVSALAVAGGIVYAAGINPSGPGGGGPGVWADGVWSALPVPQGADFIRLSALGVTGSDVYVAADLMVQNTSSYGYSAYQPGYWLNGTWVGLALPSGMVGGHAAALALSGTDVYVGGVCLDASDNLTAGYWLNGTWVGLPPPGASPNVAVAGLAVVGGEVYVANSNPSGYWLNGVWQPLLGPDGSSSCVGVALLAAQGHVYLSGYRGTSTYLPGYWLDGTWVDLTMPANAESATPGPLASDGSNLYIGGSAPLPSTNFGNGQLNTVGYWRNGTWVELAAPVPGPL